MTERRRPGLGLASASLLVLSALSACAPGPEPVTPAGEVTNPRLGPLFAQWLAGPISRLATDDELQEYLTLTSDVEAAAFVEEFWLRRDPDPQQPGNPVRETFDTRAREADRRFSEAGVLGRRTDRGTIFILYGPPEETSYEVHLGPDQPPLEVWTYPREAAEGLDGRRPATRYRFIQWGDLTVLHGGPERPRHEPRPDPW